MHEVIIIGGGPGGYTAALYCARGNIETVVIEKYAPGGQMGTTEWIDNYPGFADGINGFELGMQMQKGAERFGVKTIMAEVLSVDLSSQPKKVITTDGTYEAKVIIIATGSYPRELGLPNERELRGKGVVYCATCDGMFYRGKTVAVLGGGNTAVADALYLAKLCKKVYIIHRRDELRASKSYLKSLEDTENIEFIWDSVVESIVADEKVTGVKIRNKKNNEISELACEGIFVAIGNHPNSELFKGQIAIDESGYIIADETTKTNAEGVFAIGDVRTKPLRQIVTAVSDGATASKFAEEYLL